MKKVSDEFVKGKNNIGYVYSDFAKEFNNDDLEKGTVLKSQKLTRSMYDADIIKEFNVQECTMGDVLATINSATDDMKDGYSNIFYIKGHPSRVVYVRWHDDEWYVFDWCRDGRTWREGRRVFAPATGTESSSTLGSETLTLENAIKICKENGLKVIKMVEQEL